jgi:CheY-like chemotaxis protein
MYKNVMVIDDSHFDRLIAQKVIQLSKFSQNVITIDCPLKGLERLSVIGSSPDQIPEVIFLDISMPGTDGFGFLEKLEHIDQSIKDNIKIHMLSSSIDPEDIKRAKKSKYVFSFISKPLTIEKLLNL